MQKRAEHIFKMDKFSEKVRWREYGRQSVCQSEFVQP